MLGLDDLEEDGGGERQDGRDVVAEEDFKEGEVGFAELGEGEDLLEGDGEGQAEGHIKSIVQSRVFIQGKNTEIHIIP